MSYLNPELNWIGNRQDVYTPTDPSLYTNMGRGMPDAPSPPGYDWRTPTIGGVANLGGLLGGAGILRAGK